MNLLFVDHLDTVTDQDSFVVSINLMSPEVIDRGVVRFRMVLNSMDARRSKNCFDDDAAASGHGERVGGSFNLLFGDGAVTADDSDVPTCYLLTISGGGSYSDLATAKELAVEDTFAQWDVVDGKPDIPQVCHVLIDGKGGRCT